jgi:hypothetical protein
MGEKPERRIIRFLRMHLTIIIHPSNYLGVPNSTKEAHLDGEG